MLQSTGVWKAVHLQNLHAEVLSNTGSAERVETDGSPAEPWLGTLRDSPPRTSHHALQVHRSLLCAAVLASALMHPNALPFTLFYFEND